MGARKSEATEVCLAAALAALLRMAKQPARDFGPCLLQSLDFVARKFGLSEEEFEEAAKMLNFHYSTVGLLPREDAD